MQFSRRAFLGVARRGPGTAVRPPWALPEAEFLARCTRCADCVDACPSRLLVKGSGGFPEADFTPGRAPEGCTFCGECRHVCLPAALHEVDGRAPWSLRAHITGDCLASRQVVCYTCRESCPTHAIHFQLAAGGIALPLLDAATCTGCGACLADCPGQAICIQSVSVSSQVS